MSRNKHLKLTVLPLAIVSLALVFSISAPGAPKADAAGSYMSCLAKVKKIDDVSRLRNKAVYPAVDQRLATINELRKKADTLPADHQAVIEAGLNADTEFLNQMRANSAKTTDVQVLRTNYCQIIYQTQIYQFRARQVAYIKYVDARIKRDMTFQSILNSPYNTNVQSSLKAPIDERYNSARASIDANLAAERADANAILSSRVSDYTNNLTKPSFGGTDVTANYRNAVLQYTEASALKRVAASYNPDRSLSLVSIQLKDKNDQVATASAKESTKAVVTVKVGGEKNDRTRTLVRSDSVSAWRISK